MRSRIVKELGRGGERMVKGQREVERARDMKKRKGE